MKVQISKAIKDHIREAMLLGRSEKKGTIIIPYSLLRMYMLELRTQNVKAVFDLDEDNKGLHKLNLEWK